jgi:hypothetical protein
VTRDEKRLDGFIRRYSPAVAAVARAALARMRARLPGAAVMVYDNYNGLVIGFGPSERASEAVFSIVLYPRWVTLFFLRGASLPDPQGVLSGSGRLVRHLRLEDASTLDRAPVKALMAEALGLSARPLRGGSPGRLVIKSVSPRQRPRRPPPSARAAQR